MFAGWMPWKWIVWGWLPALRKRTRRRSSSVARMTGPGAVPLYVHAGYVTPWATWMSTSRATSVYSRGRPGLCGRAAGGIRSASIAGSRSIDGASEPIIAACPTIECAWSWPSCVAERSESANATRASGPAAISGAAPAISFFRLNFVTSKLYIRQDLNETANLSQSVQDYLKELYKLQADGRASTSGLAERMGVAPASATAMLKKLAQLGLVEHEPYRGARLTPSGERVAIEMIRHHRLLEQYLSQSLGISIDAVHAEADRLEHALSEELEAAIDQSLGFPTHDPHGDPIPSAEARARERRKRAPSPTSSPASTRPSTASPTPTPSCSATSTSSGWCPASGSSSAPRRPSTGR